MLRRRPQRPQRRHMRRRPIPLVHPKPIARPTPLQPRHIPIARHLRHNTRRRNAQTPPIPPHNRLMPDRQTIHRQTIHQRPPHTDTQTRHRTPHRHMRRTQNIQPINLIRRRHTNPQPHPRLIPRSQPLQHTKQPLPLTRRQPLRIKHPRQLPPSQPLRQIRPQHHRTRINRPRQTAPPSLIHPCQQHSRSARPKPALEHQQIRRTGTHHHHEKQ